MFPDALKHKKEPVEITTFTGYCSLNWFPPLSLKAKFVKRNNLNTVKFRKKAPPNISPQTSNAKNHPLNRPSKYKTHGALYLKNCPQIESKTKQKQ